MRLLLSAPTTYYGGVDIATTLSWRICGVSKPIDFGFKRSKIPGSASLHIIGLSLNPRWCPLTIANIYPRRRMSARVCIATECTFLPVLFSFYCFFTYTLKQKLSFC